MTDDQMFLAKEVVRRGIKPLEIMVNAKKDLTGSILDIQENMINAAVASLTHYYLGIRLALRDVAEATEDELNHLDHFFLWQGELLGLRLRVHP